MRAVRHLHALGAQRGVGEKDKKVALLFFCRRAKKSRNNLPQVEDLAYKIAKLLALQELLSCPFPPRCASKHR